MTTYAVVEGPGRPLRAPAPGSDRGRIGAAQELLDFEIRADENANDKYGALRVGTT